MDKLFSFQQYKDIITIAKQNGFKLSNCFFLPAEINRKINEGTLFFENIQNGLLLLEDLTDFYRCYYYLPVEGKPEKIQLNKDAVIELPFNVTLNEKQLLQIEKIEAMGFHLGRESGVMSSASDNIVVYDDVQINELCCHAYEQDATQILDLMNLNFNPLYSFLPTLQELCSAIKEENVFVIRDGERIVAALISGFEKKVATIHLVAVDSAYRGKSLGKVIVQAYHDNYKDKAIIFQHWVDLNNAAAVNMYCNFGYKFNLRKANEYILIVKENHK